MEFEVSKAPLNLDSGVPRIVEGEDRVIVCLGDGIPVSAVVADAETVGFDYRFVDVRGVLTEPPHEGRPEVEREYPVVIDDVLDPPVIP
jgi:hypothetical protein